MTRRPDTSTRVAVIGAGYAGLAAAVRLRRRGITSFTVYEKASDLGGTWRDNTYPGAGCDIPSHLYSYEFAPYRDGRVRYPAQSQVLEYLRTCARDEGVLPHVRYDTEITAVRHDPATRGWVLHTADGRTHAADVVVSAVGQLHRPHVPALPGAEDFEGTAFHTARWDHAHGLDGRSVAVVGTGSSAAQVVPAIAGRVRRLYVVQRSANWVLPKPGARFHPALSLLLRGVPGAHRAYRSLLYRRSEAVMLRALRGNRAAGALLRGMAVRHLRAGVPDPELRARLTPDFALGCKRIVLSSDWYPTLARSDVDVVTEPIARITAKGFETADGAHREVDTIVYATGFRTTEFLAPMTVTGPGGRLLHEVWRGGARAYLGMHVPGFPNLFLMYGPNTNLGHNSVTLALDAQAEHIAGCVELLDARPDVAGMEATPEALEAWQRLVDEGCDATVWAGACTSWFKTADGTLTNNWPYRTSLYRRMTAHPGGSGFRFRPAAGAAAQGTGDPRQVAD
ncbi:4-hydroxyacetophenone monooxygenase [Streptomyces sp. CB09001]|uniref:flavin-containing monooxygenase n=1 Tax=unclassified Streptomyces TaxID=2593676 RepID=UPI000E219595|nr:NAD(P)/FAD-dependent oxidoreductase [Streptomyces sp. CB09001]AXL91896.1 4-hydroxyacetophenone monooxygenase [Streptomyces sp. CB09001]